MPQILGPPGAGLWPSAGLLALAPALPNYLVPDCVWHIPIVTHPRLAAITGIAIALGTAL